MSRVIFSLLAIGFAHFSLGISLCAAEPAQGGALLVSPLPSEPTRDPCIAGDELRYWIEEFAIEYRPADHPQQPSIEQLMKMEIELERTDRAYATGGLSDEKITLPLSDVPNLPDHWFSVHAVKAVQDAIVAYLNRQGLAGVLVLPHVQDIDRETLRDLRPQNQGTLRLVVWTAIVAQTRTIAGGETTSAENIIDHPKHEKIKQWSPIQPRDAGADEHTDILQKDLLDEYLHALNRHPGRQVDVAISSAPKPGEVLLDYLVSESKPWLAYFQLLNTGTKETERFRQRFGFRHNQLTNNDDILNVNYITATFTDIHAALASYEAPLLGRQKIRYRLHGLWSQFDSSEVGSGDARFSGREWSFGGDLIANIFQRRELFVDTVLGVRCQEIMVKSEIAGRQSVGGKENFFLPRFGLALDRVTDTASTRATIDLEWNCPGIAGTGKSEIVKLGRMDTDDNWVALHWNLSHCFYLEPLLDRDAWEDPATPETSTLAHELNLRFQGQICPDRLIPQARQTAGGFFTVRGYPESIVSGDSVFITSGEYKFHLPRTFEPRRDCDKTMLFGKPFRWAPQQVYARPDWDLIFRLFVDAASLRNTSSSNHSFSEQNTTLLGAGMGIELQFTRSFNVRCDWGIPFESVRTGSKSVDVGDGRLHVVGTLAY